MMDTTDAATAERFEMCELLDTLSPLNGSMSRCVLAGRFKTSSPTLTLTTRETLRDIIVGAIRARRNFDRLNLDSARKRSAQVSPVELVEQLRETADSTRRTPFSKPADPLIDLIIHPKHRPAARTQ